MCAHFSRHKTATSWGKNPKNPSVFLCSPGAFPEHLVRAVPGCSAEGCGEGGWKRQAEGLLGAPRWGGNWDSFPQFPKTGVGSWKMVWFWWILKINMVNYVLFFATELIFEVQILILKGQWWRGAPQFQWCRNAFFFLGETSFSFVARFSQL